MRRMATPRRAHVFTARLAVLLALGCGKTGDGDDSGSTSPKQVTLNATYELGDSEAPVRLADGVVAPDGDVSLGVGYQLYLQSPVDGAEIFCLKGTFAALADVPVDELSCPSSNDAWRARLFLSSASFHSSEQSEVIGLSALVREANLGMLYRVRMLGDTVAPNAEGSLGNATATFEYEAVSAE